MRKLFMLFILMLAAISWGVYSMLGGSSLDNLGRSDRLAGKKNIVVLGCDTRKSEGDAGRSDTLFVVMMDPKQKDASLLSIPRDTRVKIKGHGWDKINHAFAYGGEQLTKDTTEEFLGIRLDNYVVIDFKGFQNLVDVIGGIDINVEKRMYYYDAWDGFEVNLQPGKQHMDGKTAIQYVRYRDEEGDIGRIKRQQKFILAVYNRITSASILTKIPGLAKQITSMIKTDLSMREMLELGKALHSMVSGQGLKMAMVPGTPQYIDDISYWIPDIPKMRRMMVEMQGVQASDKYLKAAETLDKEYKKGIEEEKANPKVDEEKKKQDEKDNAAKKKAAALKERAAAEAKAKEQAAKEAAAKAAAAKTEVKAKPAKSPILRLVNCTGKEELADKAKRQLEQAGFRVIMEGSNGAAPKTKVLATTTSSAMVERLQNLPFSHSTTVNKVDDAGCDGIVLLGQDYK